MNVLKILGAGLLAHSVDKMGRADRELSAAERIANLDELRRWQMQQPIVVSLDLREALEKNQMPCTPEGVQALKRAYAVPYDCGTEVREILAPFI